MPPDLPYQHVSEAPTRPHGASGEKAFDVADIFSGPVATSGASGPGQTALDEKLRQAYFWIVNNAIINPLYDIEFSEGVPHGFEFGDSKTPLVLPSSQSYSSFVLIPLLNFAVRKRCLLVGGPGRGKTASAVLMGILAGYSIKEVRRGMQHGQPQMTIADLLGNPLPSGLVKAERMSDIQVAWREWLSMRVKIIDEYNRIPTRTQSALLTVMADNYAEMLDQIIECPEAAWFLTANDDAGGGTYQVIQALRDRIDVVVHALSFNMRFLGDLLARVEGGYSPESVVPKEIIFTPEELDSVYAAILRVQVPPQILRRIEFFASQFEFFEPAGAKFEYQTKDTAQLSGIDFSQLTAQETGRDRRVDPGSQTRNGLSVRSLMTLLVFAKALAWFRGNPAVGIEDLRQIVPFVLHDKLVPDIDAPYFDGNGHEVYRVDRISWLRNLLDQALGEYDRLGLDTSDPVGTLMAEFNQGLEGLTETECKRRMVAIERVLAEWHSTRKVYGHVFDDVIALKYLHQRYTNYLAWVTAAG